MITRDNLLLNKCLIIDGQPGCGKTLFSSILVGYEKVELLNYSTEIENICSLYSYKSINLKGAKAFIKTHLDLMIYETMMSRRINFRHNDLSSALNNPNKNEYIKRLYLKGDEQVPKYIKQKKPILHLATHNLLPISKPIFEAYKDTNKLHFLVILRHPLYMIEQQIINQKNFAKDKASRNFRIFYKYKNNYLSYWNLGDKSEYISASNTEKAILDIYNLTKLYDRYLNNKNLNILSIPFEQFVLNPNEYLNLIEKKFSLKRKSSFNKVLKKQKIPRKKISDGISLNVYIEKGWKKPIINLNEKQELSLRKKMLLKRKINKKYLHLLDYLIEDYEKKYMINIL